MQMCEVNDGWILQNGAKSLGFLEKRDGWTARQVEQAIQVINGAVEEAASDAYDEGHAGGRRDGYADGCEDTENEIEAAK